MDSCEKNPPEEMINAFRSRRLPTDPEILLKWVNALLQSSFESLEDLRSGVVYCRLLHSLYPGCIKLENLHDYPMILWEKNYEALRDSLEFLGLDPHLDVSKLMRGSSMDSTFLLHFFIDLYNMHIGLSMERRGADQQDQKKDDKESKPKQESKNSAIYELFQWFRNLLVGSDPLPPSDSPSKKSLDFERQVRLLLFEPVPLSELKEQNERQTAGGSSGGSHGRQDRHLQEAERQQRRRDHDQLHSLVDACLQLRHGHQLMQELWLQSRKERRGEGNFL